MDEQTSQQNQSVSAPVRSGLSTFQKDLIISAAIGLFCAILILPIAQNLEIKQSLALSLLVILPALAVAGMWAAYWLVKKFKIFYQLAKFILVGAFNTFVDWGILNLLMFLAGIAAGTFYTVFKGISFLAAMTGSYFWSKYWTFKKTPTEDAAANKSAQEGANEMLRFFIVSLIGFLMNVGIASFLVNFLGPQMGAGKELWANVGALAGTILGLGWNFMGYKLIVFKE